MPKRVKNFHEIRDPLHVFIRLDSDELLSRTISATSRFHTQPSVSCCRTVGIMNG